MDIATETAHTGHAGSGNLHERLRRFSRWAGVATVATSFMVTVGWILDIGALKGVLPGLATMKLNTAVAIALCGFALIALTGNRVHRQSRSGRLIARSC